MEGLTFGERLRLISVVKNNTFRNDPMRDVRDV